MKKLDWFILAILLISPIMINYIVLEVSIGATINGSVDGWSGYYGTLIGSIITMFVLYRTRVWNKDDNEDTRKSQNNILKYQAKLDMPFLELVQTDDRLKNDNERINHIKRNNKR